MATIDKNFRIKNGLVVEGSTATVNGNQILTENASDQYILNLIGGETLVKSVSGRLSVDNLGNLSVDEEGIFDDFISNGMATTTDVSNAVSTASTDATNKANAAEQNAKDYADGLASNYDPVGSAQGAYDNAVSTASSDATTKANAAEQNAKNYADGLASNYDAAGAATTAENNAKGYADSLAGNYDPAGAADTALQSAEGYADQAAGQALLDAENYTDTAITNLNLSGTYDALGAATTALNDAKAYTDQEVSALVDSAPALLDTLNELAAAIADNPNYATDVANLVATKADTTYVDSEISDLNTAAQGYATTAENNAKSYADGLSSNYDAVGSATTAENNAKSYADGLASNYDAAGAASNALNDANSYTDSAISNGNSAATPAYQAINLAGYTRQVGNWAQAGTAGTQVTAFSYSASWGSAEFLVRVMSNTSGHQHSQLSKLLVTTDGAGNVAITEYGIVTTNGNMGDVTASNVGGTINILVTPTYASSEVIVSGTLLAYND